MKFYRSNHTVVGTSGFYADAVALIEQINMGQEVKYKRNAGPIVDGKISLCV